MGNLGLTIWEASFILRIHLQLLVLQTGDKFKEKLFGHQIRACASWYLFCKSLVLFWRYLSSILLLIYPLYKRYLVFFIAYVDGGGAVSDVGPSSARALQLL